MVCRICKGPFAPGEEVVELRDQIRIGYRHQGCYHVCNCGRRFTDKKKYSDHKREHKRGRAAQRRISPELLEEVRDWT